MLRIASSSVLNSQIRFGKFSHVFTGHQCSVELRESFLKG